MFNSLSEICHEPYPFCFIYRYRPGFDIHRHVVPCRAPDTSDAQNYKSHKALLIGVDGMQYEKLQQAIQNNMAPILPA